MRLLACIRRETLDRARFFWRGVVLRYRLRSFAKLSLANVNHLPDADRVARVAGATAAAGVVVGDPSRTDPDAYLAAIRDHKVHLAAAAGLKPSTDPDVDFTL